MSGYAAIIRFDGRPVASELVSQLMESLRFRGPDGEGTWIGGQVALAHSLLAIAPESKAERQPLHLGDLVVAGDIRIDGRAQLVSALRARGRDVFTRTPDSELLLHAYATWGEGLLEHLIGDFSFAIWDAARRHLFCARDHFARRPLFVADHDGATIVTNNLPTLLALPGVPEELDELAIADFLLFGRNLHPERTTFANIRRVPAAHRLIVSADGRDLTRYWTIPSREEPRRITEGDAQAEFREMLTRAVMDRARADRVVISLSGGLDSNAVAATLTRHRTEGLTALTTVWNELFEDEEGRFARIGADAYGIPIEFHVADDCEAFQGWDDPRVAGLEPTDEPCTAMFFTFMARAFAHGRVVLTGEGGDPALYTSHDYFVRLLQKFKLFRFVREAAEYALTRRKRPPLLLRSQILRALGRKDAIPAYPTWIAPDFEQRLNLRQRWEEIYAARPASHHPYRANAWHLLDSPTWADNFESNDAGATGFPVEWRSPYFDVRLIEFLFSLPPMPHFANKDLVRQSLKGWIPDEVRLRRKTPLPTDPSAIELERSGRKWTEAVQQSDALGAFVERRELCDAILGEVSQYRRSQQAYGISLALWLRNRKNH